MKIIVVDNEPDRLEELVKCLRAAFPNAEITDFTSPSLAVQYSFENPVDLVFAEYYTRRFNGIQVAEGIHHFRPETMIYLVTDDNTGLAKKKNKEIIGCLVRPFVITDIQKRIERDSKTLERKLRIKNNVISSHSRPRRNKL